MMVAIIFPVRDKLNTLTAPVQRPIIRLPQYREIYLEILLSSRPASVRYPGVFNNAPKLLSMVTSTPTYTKIPSIPYTRCGYFIAPHPDIGRASCRVRERISAAHV